MIDKDFYNDIQVIAKRYSDEFASKKGKQFLINLDALMLQDEDSFVKNTKITVLFEGFYSSLDESKLKEELLLIRMKKWSRHFGLPTVVFLLSYYQEIQAIADQFIKIDKDEFISLNINWQIDNAAKQIDSENNVLINSEIFKKIGLPEQEKKGQFIKTYNPFGGFTTAACDDYSQQFIISAKEIAKNGGQMLEIGSAFGVAAMPILAQGANIFCNDVNPQNLAVIQNRWQKKNGKLTLLPGSFPEELVNLPSCSFDAILISRVLHFFSGKKIGKSFQLLFSLLKPKGKLFVVCETPYLKNWQRFIPEYEKRLEKGVEWPGEITHPADFESTGRAATLPSFVHWITKDILIRSLQQYHFNIEKISYIDRKNQFPADLILDGRESVGAIAVKY